MKVILVKPGSPAIMAEIDNSIESYRRIVEGTPQEAFFFEDDPNVALICNEEGKLLNLPANRVIQSDIIAGTFFVCNLNITTGKYDSLTNEQIQKYIELFNGSDTYFQSHMEETIRVFREGGIIPELCIHQDGCILNYTGIGLNIYVLIDNPTEMDLRKANTVFNGLKLSVSVHEKNVMCFAVKSGALPWCDTAFTPHLCPNAIMLKEKIIPFGNILAGNYFLVNSANGMICELRTFALSKQFSNYVLKAMQNLLEDPFDKDTFYKNISTIQRKYSPKELGEQFKDASFNLRGK